MKYCKSCNIKYEAPLEHCLFCNNPLIAMDSLPARPADSYPLYQKMHHRRKAFLKIMSFLVLIADIICLLVNYLVSSGSLTWSIDVVASTLYGLLLLSLWTQKGLFLKKAVKTLLLTDVLLLIIGLVAHNYHWCTDYTIPATLMAANFISVFYLFGKRQKLFDYSVFPFSLSILTLIYGLLLFTQMIANPWCTVVGIVYSLITIVALFFFAPKASWEEIRRRLYM